MKEYELDEAMYVRNYIVLEKENQLSIWQIIALSIFGGGLIVVTALIGQYIASIIFIGITAIFAWYWIKGPEWTARRNYRISNVLKNPIKVEINEEGIYYATSQGEGMLNRNDFFRIRETEELVFVQHNNGVHLYIPLSCLTPKEADLIRETSSVVDQK